VLHSPIIDQHHLIADYGVRVNILRASIDPGKPGRMFVKLSGEYSQLSLGLNYLDRTGVQVEPAGAGDPAFNGSVRSCMPHCPTQALMWTGFPGRFLLILKNALSVCHARMCVSIRQ